MTSVRPERRGSKRRPKTPAVIIFGGSGFIGGHFAEQLLTQMPEAQITLADILPLPPRDYMPKLSEALRRRQANYVQADVRQSLALSDKAAVSATLIINAAAIHREPGHAAHEYFETNIAGAENVCDYASRVGCERIVFTSSIAPYGPGEDAKDETTLPMPETPYGSSKLVAEKIHQCCRALKTDQESGFLLTEN